MAETDPSASEGNPPLEPDRLEAIAETVGTPTYVYDARIIHRQADRLEEMFGDLPHRFLYAIKANFRPEILRLLHGRGFGFDAVSPAEALLARRHGAGPDEILYSANNLTDEEMIALREQGLLLNLGERSRLEKYGRSFPGSEVCLRLNPDVGAGHHDHVITAGPETKFGIPVDQLEEARRLVEEYDLRVVGLHQHIGSGILEVETLWEAVRVLLDAAESFPGLRFLNFGGGLGIPYRPDQDEIAVEEVRAQITRRLRAHAEESDPSPEFWFEPGRYLVGPAGTLITRVTTCKETSARRFAGCDTGLNHLLRPALYGSYHHISNVSRPDGPARSYDVVGNICETGDYLARDRRLPEIREGDLLAVHDAGAYGRAMASHYNLRPLPAEVWIDEGGDHRLVRERRGPADLLDELGL